MNDYFDVIFKEAYELRKQDAVDLETEITLYNQYSQQIYSLTQRYLSSPSTFVGTDLDMTEVHVKILHCGTFAMVKLAHQKLRKAYEQFPANSLLKVIDSFELFDEDSWFLVCVSYTLQAVSIYDLSEYINAQVRYLHKDLCISVFLLLLSILRHSHGEIHPFCCIYPNTAMILRSSIGLPLCSTSSSSYSLAILPISKYTLLGDRSRVDNFNTEASGDLWGIAISVYGLIGSFPLNTLPVMKTIGAEHILDITPIRENDPALERILRLALHIRPSQSDIEGVLLHPYLAIWKGICRKDWETIDKCGIDELEVLHSGLYFSDPISQKLVIKKLLVLGKSYHEVYEYLLKYEIFGDFVDKCIKLNWNECPELLEPFYKILRKKPKDYIFKEKLCELGILGLASTTISLDPYNRGFYEFVQDFMCENTLTLMQVLYDSGVTKRSLEMAKKRKQDKNFIRDTMSYYGPHSPEVIEQVYSLDIFPVIRIMQALIDIPYYHRAQKIESVLQIILMIIKKKGTKEDYDVIKCTLDLVTEILCLPYLIENNHLEGRCCSHSAEENFLLSKNPLLYSCLNCNVPVCTYCFKALHSGHTCYNLLYMTPHFRCNCTEIHEFITNSPGDFGLINLETRFTFIPSIGHSVSEMSVNRFVSDIDMIITTIEPLAIGCDGEGLGIVAYYEVSVNKAGKYENIVVGLHGPEIYYHGMNGSITRGSNLIGKGPRFGSFDTIGIGIMKSSKVFITYNGLLCGSFYDSITDGVLNKEIKIFVAMYGEHCEVEIKLRDFLFQSLKVGAVFTSLDARKSLEKIFKVLMSSLKKGSDRKIVELKERFRGLLQEIKRDDLIKQLDKKGIF